MKKILFIAFCLGISVNLFAQNTFPFPSSGDVGIGTTTPITTLEVKFNTNNSGLISAPLDFTGDQLVIRNENTTTGIYAGIGFVGNVNELLGRIGFKRHGFGNGRGEFFVAVDDAGVVTEALTINKNGKVGIGTATPQQMIHISSTSDNVGLQVETTGNNVAGIELKTNSSTDWQIAAGGTGATRANDFYIYDRGANVSRLLISDSGNVGINTSTPTEKLEVAGNARIVGNIYSKKVKVSATAGSWPDYVFENGYQLTPLSQLEAFVKTYKHLPEIPSAQEVEAKGQNLGEIQTTLLKKVEELTLYTIEQHKQIQKVMDENTRLTSENEELKMLFLELKKDIDRLKKDK